MNINDNAKSSASQCAKIKAWLLQGHKLTSLEALKLFGCMRLASRITTYVSKDYTSTKREYKFRQAST